MTTVIDIEQALQHELMRCPECGELVYTKAAEGVPAQLLRACDECGAAFFMDYEEQPIDSNATGHEQPEQSERSAPTPHTLSNFRMEYIKPDYSQGHSFEPRCAILADDAALGGVEVRVFDVPDPDEGQREVAEWACGVMNRHEELLITLNQIRVWLISPAIDAESMEEMRGVVNRALAGKTD